MVIPSFEEMARYSVSALGAAWVGYNLWGIWKDHKKKQAKI